MKWAHLISFLSLFSHIDSRIHSPISYAQAPDYETHRCIVQLNPNLLRFDKPEKLNFNFDGVLDLPNGKQLQFKFSIRQGQIFINNPFNQDCQAHVMQNAEILEAQINSEKPLGDAHHLPKGHPDEEPGHYMGDFVSPARSSELEKTVDVRVDYRVPITEKAREQEIKRQKTKYQFTLQGSETLSQIQEALQSKINSAKGYRPKPVGSFEGNRQGQTRTSPAFTAEEVVKNGKVALTHIKKDEPRIKKNSNEIKVSVHSEGAPHTNHLLPHTPGPAEQLLAGPQVDESIIKSNSQDSREDKKMKMRESTYRKEDPIPKAKSTIPENLQRSQISEHRNEPAISPSSSLGRLQGTRIDETRIRSIFRAEFEKNKESAKRRLGINHDLQVPIYEQENHTPLQQIQKIDSDEFRESSTQPVMRQEESTKAVSNGSDGKGEFSAAGSLGPSKTSKGFHLQVNKISDQPVSQEGNIEIPKNHMQTTDKDLDTNQKINEGQSVQKNGIYKEKVNLEVSTEKKKRPVRTRTRELQGEEIVSAQLESRNSFVAARKVSMDLNLNQVDSKSAQPTSGILNFCYSQIIEKPLSSVFNWWNQSPEQKIDTDEPPPIAVELWNYMIGDTQKSDDILTRPFLSESPNEIQVNANIERIGFDDTKQKNIINNSMSDKRSSKTDKAKARVVTFSIPESSSKSQTLGDGYGKKQPKY